MEAQAGANGGPPQGAHGGFEHPSVLQNQDPSSLTDTFGSVISFLQSYGWFILLGTVLALFLKSKFEPSIQNYRKKREEQDYLNTDPETARQRQEAMERHRHRLQEEHDAQAARHAELQKEKDAKKRQEKIDDWERHQRGEGYRSKVKREDEPPTSSSSTSSQQQQQSKSKKPVYRSSDYNPLMGGSGGACFRPPRRGGGG